MGSIFIKVLSLCNSVTKIVPLVSELKDSWSICEHPLCSSMDVGQVCSKDEPVTAANLMNQLKQVGIIIIF
jgi:hypothetical protein